MSSDNSNALERMVAADRFGIDADQLAQGFIQDGWGVYDRKDNLGSTHVRLVDVHEDEVTADEEATRLNESVGQEVREVDDDPESTIIYSRYFSVARVSLTGVNVSVHLVANYEQIDEGGKTMNHETQSSPVTPEQYLVDRKSWISKAMEILGYDAEVDPTEVLPEPTEVRADAEPLDLDADQEAQLREIAGKIGISGEQDVRTGADHQIIEGGLAWKIDAEAAVCDASRKIIFSGTPHRKIERDDEMEYLKAKFGDDTEFPETEYDLARMLAMSQPGFEPIEEELVYQFGYDINNGFKVTQGPTGQLVQIGVNDGRPVLLLRVDRENYVDEEGKTKYRNQPQSADLMRIVADIMDSLGLEKGQSVGLITSSAYFPSREIDAVRANMGSQPRFAVGMYSVHTLAETKGVDPEPSDLSQIPGELHTAAARLKKLASEITSQ